MTRSGSWVPVFWTAVVCNVVAAALAVLWLKPRVAKLIREQLAEGEPVFMKVEQDAEVKVT